MWYVIQVMTGREDDIAGKLKEQGFRALVPKENRIIRSGGQWIRKPYILFNGYVFVDITTFNAENYYKIKNQSGVLHFLSVGDSSNPSTLSYLEAEWIMRLTGKDNAPIEPTVVRTDENGDLKVVKGILETFENRVVRYDKRNRKATVEITLCNEKKEVQLSIELEEDLKNMKDVEETAAQDATEQVL